jgi:hypothetical protein
MNDSWSYHNHSSGGSGLPEGGDPHRQLVTDENGVTAWSERLAYKTQNKTSLWMMDAVEGSIDAPYMVEDLPLLVEEETYYVVFDGIEYSCIAHTLGENIFLGNASFINNIDTGEPFIIIYNTRLLSGIIAIFESGTHSIEIKKYEDVYKALDAEYLPDVVPVAKEKSRPIAFDTSTGSDRYVYDVFCDIESVVYGAEYTFDIVVTGSGTYLNKQYLAKSQTVKAIAIETNDREGNPAVEFNFSDVWLLETADGAYHMAGMSSVIFYDDYVYCPIGATTSASYIADVSIKTDVPSVEKRIALDKVRLWDESDDSFKRFDLTVGASGVPKLTNADDAADISVIPVIQSAQIGQTLVVKAVDENGKPTEWEAVDGGGSKPAIFYYTDTDNYIRKEGSTDKATIIDVMDAVMSGANILVYRKYGSDVDVIHMGVNIDVLARDYATFTIFEGVGGNVHSVFRYTSEYVQQVS